jgi:diphthine methyl ester acylhydrolase
VAATTKMLEPVQDPGKDPGRKNIPGPITKVCDQILELPPSCVEFSPKQPDCFVIGTYNLEKDSDNIDDDKSGGQDSDAPYEKKPQSRNGSLILCRLLNDDV